MYSKNIFCLPKCQSKAFECLAFSRLKVSYSKLKLLLFKLCIIAVLLGIASFCISTLVGFCDPLKLAFGYIDR